MKYLHIKNLEKYHPGYKDRTLQWAKIYFSTVQGDPECELLNEIDWARLVKLIVLELQAKKPIPWDEAYLIKKGFDLANRSMSLTLQMLHNFIDVVTEESKVGNVYKEEVYEEEKEEERDTGGEKHPPIPTQKLIDLYHKNCSTLPNVVSMPLSKTSQGNLQQRWREHPDLDWWEDYFARIARSGFLRGDNDKGWMADFQWIIKPSNMEKIVNGRYDRSRGKGRHAAPADRSKYADL